MPKIRFIEHDGTQHEVDGQAGESLKDIALANGVPGIVGYCGGFMMCGTCNGYIDAEWVERLPPPNEEEEAMLENVLHRQVNSRLTCQVIINDELDGIVVHLPQSQD